MKYTLRQMRRLATSRGYSWYQQGGQWIVVSDSYRGREEHPQHYSIKTERECLEDILADYLMGLVPA